MVLLLQSAEWAAIAFRTQSSYAERLTRMMCDATLVESRYLIFKPVALDQVSRASPRKVTVRRRPAGQENEFFRSLIWERATDGLETLTAAEMEARRTAVELV